MIPQTPELPFSKYTQTVLLTRINTHYTVSRQAIPKLKVTHVFTLNQSAITIVVIVLDGILKMLNQTRSIGIKSLSKTYFGGQKITDFFNEFFLTKVQ